MKLTNAIREAFVRSAMSDVPKIAHEDHAHSLIQKEARAQLPPKIREVYDDNELRGYLKCDRYVALPGVLQSTYFIARPGFKASETLTKELEKISALERAQRAKLSDLKKQLEGAANSVTTRKALAELLPEFAKYLPPEPVPTKNLPAVQNIVADFTKAGWPKGK